MNPRDNPYTPGAGRKPPLLAGRDGDLDQFRLVLDRLGVGQHERSMIFHGLRGVGKTVLLIELDTLALEAGWVSTGVHEVGSQLDFRVTFGRLAARLLQSMSLRERMKKRAVDALRVVRSFSVHAPGGIGLQLDIDPMVGTADSGDPEEDLADLITAIGQVAQVGDSGALFVLDEMQNLDAGSLAAICMAFHRVSQQALPVALTGAGLPTLPSLLRDAKPYAARLFTYHSIERLSEAAVHAALVGPASRNGVTYGDGTVGAVFDATEGYPYFVQEYGRALWNEIEDSPVMPDDVKAVHDLVSSTLASDFFEPAFELATDAEQRYLMAMADLGDGPQRTAEVNRHLGHTSPGGSSQERGSLLGKELIWVPRRGLVDFTVPRFGEFLRTSYAFGARDSGS